MPIHTDLERVADELPVPLYLVAPDGEFLFANQRLRALLNLPSGDLGGVNIAAYYYDPQVRIEMINAIRSGAVIEKRSVRLKTAEREIEVLMFCREAIDHHAKPLGFLGVVVEITDDAEFRRVFDAHLTSGIYRVNADDRVTHANVAFANMLGFRSVDDVLTRSFHDFHASVHGADRVRQVILEKRGMAVRESVQLRRADGVPFSAYLTAVAFFNAGTYVGQGGIIEDRTSEERYTGIFDDVPVGFYYVETEGNKDVVKHCNQEFARIHDVPTREEMIGRDLRITHHVPEESVRFLQKLRAAAKVAEAVRGEILQIRTATGVIKTVEVHSRPKVVDGKMIGRTGTIRDISDEMEMKNTLTVMFDDLSGILHTFKHTLTQLKHSVASASEALAGEPDVKKTNRTPEELEHSLRGPLRELSTTVSVLVNAASSADHATLLERDQIAEVERLTGVMSRATQELTKAHWRDIWLRGAVRIEHICSKIPAGTVARSTYRPVIAAAQRISRVAALATLGNAREAIESMATPLTALRDFATSGIRQMDEMELCWIEECIRDAINSVTGFAEERKVQIRFADATRTPVRVARLEVTRALNNLLHNAIKYSWRREDGKTWISVSVSISDRAMVVTSIENWGVPIPQDEIDLGHIFRLGYRGRLSSDRGRVGTGVGLADSMRVARAQRGMLRVESRPASGSADLSDHSLPFLTTAYLDLPLAREGAQRR